MSYARLTQLEPRDGLAGIGERLRQEITTSGGGESQLDAAAAALLAAADLPGSRLEQAWRESRGALLRLLARLVVHAPFLAPVLAAQPQWLLDLTGDDLARPRGAETYRAELEEELAASSETQAPQILRRFKYRSLVRITARELSPELIPDSREPEVLAEISALADVLLQAALRLADQRTRERFGLPAGSGEVAEFVILGLGKLGAAELNYSSDVDLVYVFEAAGGGTLAEKVAPVEYYTRLAQELGRIVAAQGPDGFLYRVDLELRPEGKQGALVIADSAFLQYYDTWAATWEKAAAMKARPVAGDLAFGWRLIRSLGPMLYRTSVDYDSIAAITDLKNLTAAAYTDPDAFDIKRGSGGIRDVETIAQALQLVHGGQIPQVRRRGTEAALQGLAEVGVLQRGDADALLAAYRFLRRLEHRVQMIGERQTHSFPAAPEERAQLGRSLGYHKDPAVQLEQALAQHRATVEELLRRLFPEDTADRIMGFFASRIPDLLAHSAGRDAMQELAAHFAREIEGGPNPQRGLNNLERFTAGIGHRRFYYELLLDRPELVPRLATLFATSEHLSSYLATYPRLIEPIFEDPTVLLLDRPQLEANFAALSRQLAAEHGGSDSETQLDTLRLFHHRELVNVGLLDIVGEVSRREAETALTDIAEVCLDHALALAHEQLAQRPVPHPEASFLVVGMGKLASRELTYGSDLDVIFLYDLPAANEYQYGEAQDYFVRLAQKLIWALCTRTAAGLCYEVDARLRPSGNQGPLVSSLEGFRAYHARSAQVWERQALLRARPVAGDAELGARFSEERTRILQAPLPAGSEREVHRIRLRMEGELARETSQRHDFKTGSGGLLDVETVVQLHQLRYARSYPELLDTCTIEAQLDRLDQRGLLAPEDADTLRRGWEFLQRLSSRLRIVENRSISDLDEERGDLDSVARALGYTSPQRRGGARRALLEDYRRHTTAVRAVYRRVVGN